jgi:hypothetical protein
MDTQSATVEYSPDYRACIHLKQFIYVAVA